MTSAGALLMLVGGAALSVALVAGLYAVFGVWGALAAASIVAIGVGRFLIQFGGQG